MLGALVLPMTMKGAARGPMQLRTSLIIFGMLDWNGRNGRRMSELASHSELFL